MDEISGCMSVHFCPQAAVANLIVFTNEFDLSCRVSYCFCLYLLENRIVYSLAYTHKDTFIHN